MRLPTLLILSAAALLVGCGEETNEQGPPPAVLGIESDRLGLPLLREAAGRFEQEDRRGRVRATAADEDEAFNGFCSDDPRLDAVVVTRGITDDERRRCLDKGVLSRVAPSPASVQSNRYAPLAKLLRVYVSLDALRRPALRRFLDLLVDHRAALAEAGGLVPLSEADPRQAREALRMRPPPEAEPRRSGG